MPELRDDPLTGEVVLLAPGRAARPQTVARGSAVAAGPATCPFCPGHESETPPEVARVGGGAPNGPGWRLRAFPNLYPIVGGGDATPGATGADEVVVFSAEHDRDLARLSDDAAVEAFALLRDRSAALAAAGHAYVQVSVNQGAAAGASIAHPHAQILALDFVAPAVRAALARFAAAGIDLVDADATRAEELGTVVMSHDRTRAWCAAASSMPYEVRVADGDAGPRFAAASDAAVRAVAVTVRDVLARLAVGAPRRAVQRGGARRPDGWCRPVPLVDPDRPPRRRPRRVRARDRGAGGDGRGRHRRRRVAAGSTVVTVTIRCDERIGASPSAVWADIERLETHPEWMADALHIDFESDQRRGVGTELVCLTCVGPLRTHDRLVVTEWDPERAMSIEHRGAVRGVGRFTLTPSGAATRFGWEEALRFPWWLGGPVGERAAAPILARVWRANLARLRDRVEGRDRSDGEDTTGGADPSPR